MTYPYAEPEVTIDHEGRAKVWRIILLVTAGFWMGVFLTWWLY